MSHHVPLNYYNIFIILLLDALILSSLPLSIVLGYKASFIFSDIVSLPVHLHTGR